MNFSFQASRWGYVSKHGKQKNKKKQLCIRTFRNLIISPHCLIIPFHTWPHATTISWGPVSFQEPLAFFPLPRPYARLSTGCTEWSRFTEERRKEERAGLCTRRIAPKFVCAAARLLPSPWNYFWWRLHTVSACGRRPSCFFLFFFSHYK